MSIKSKKFLLDILEVRCGVSLKTKGAVSKRSRGLIFCFAVYSWCVEFDIAYLRYLCSSNLGLSDDMWKEGSSMHEVWQV